MTQKNAIPPPNNLDAEESVLGSMMLSEHAIDAVVERLTAADFYRDSHGVIFSAAVALRDEGESVDAITVAARLERDGTLEGVGGRARIHEIATLVPAASNAGHYAAIVAEASSRRALITAGVRIARLGRDGTDAPETLIEEAQGIAFDMSHGRVTDFTPSAVATGNAVDRLTHLYEGGHDIVGIPTGFRDIDRLTSGLQPGNMIVLAARPSMGKSGLVAGIAAHVALRVQRPVAFFTLEMTQGEVMNRILSIEALVETTKFLNGRMDRDEWERVMHAAGRLAQAPLFIDSDRMITPAQIRSKCRRLKLRHPNLGLVIVDYLQLMATQIRDKVNEVAQISRMLKIIAGEVDVPVIAISQLSRALESRHDRRPILSDLRDSGALEQDADVVMFIYRDEVYNPEDPETAGIAELNIAKQRNGPTDTATVSFVKRYAMFSEMPRPGDGGPRDY